MIRSILVVLFGFIFIGVLSFGADAVLKVALPTAFDSAGRVESIPVLLIIIAYVCLFAVTGCYLTARFAPARPMFHALVLGGFGFVFSIFGTIMAWQTAPAWYHIVSLLLVMPSAWLGGTIRERQLAAKPSKE